MELTGLDERGAERDDFVIVVERYVSDRVGHWNTVLS